MWQDPIKDLLTLDPPKDPISQNFNPYEVLEPQKVNLKDKILVDLTPNEEVIKPDAKLEIGSFLDTVTKTDYNLVDLFQNIYVTPQHLRKTPTEFEKDSLIDFCSFSDKLEDENVQKHDVTVEKLDNSNITRFDEFIHRTALYAVSKQSEENEIKMNKETLGAPYRLSVPKFDPTTPEKSEYAWYNDIKCLHLKSDPPMETETTKAENKVDISEFKTDFDYINYYMTKQTKDHSKVISDQNNLRDCPGLKSELSHFQLTDRMRRNILDEVKRDNIPIKCKCYYASNILNLNKSMDASFTNPFDNDIPVNHSKDLKKPKAINMLSNNQFTQIKSGQLLQTVVKDQKLYAKQKNFKESYQNLTKGPDIYEKSIILPQIMERLAARKKVLDDQRNWKRRLVLDSGVSKCDECIDTNKTEVLMADCNKERLANLKVRMSFEKFIKTGLPK